MGHISEDEKAKILFIVSGIDKSAHDKGYFEHGGSNWDEANERWRTAWANLHDFLEKITEPA